jgi:hypothetical protein
MLVRLLLWALPLLLVACGARAPLAPAPFDLTSVSPRHKVSFVSLLAALETQQNEAAEDLLDQLIPRLQEEVEQGDEAQVAEVNWQLRAAKRFRRILLGRERLAALDFNLEIADYDGERSLVLLIRNRWPGVLVLRPGPAMLEQHSMLIGPGGEGSEHARSRVITGLDELELGPLERLEVSLGPYRKMPLGGALAQRETFVLRLGTGGLQEGGEVYPAQMWPEARSLRVNLAAFLPNGVLDPSELLGRMEDGSMGIAALVERVVRISPERYEEALRGTRGAVARATPEIFSRMEPLLRWLCSHDPQPSGLEGWRAHLARLPER